MNDVQFSFVSFSPMISIVNLRRLLQCYLIGSCRKTMAKWLHLLNSKIQLVILPTDYHTFLYKSDKRIWYYIRITPTS